MSERNPTLEVCAKKSAVARLRPIWAVAISAPWKLAALLLSIVTLSRGAVMLGPAGGGGPWMAAQFVLMAAVPFVFFDREGRRTIGLRPPSAMRWLLWGPVLGGLAAVAIGLLGVAMFGWTPDNWYVSF